MGKPILESENTGPWSVHFWTSCFCGWYT